MDELRDWMKGRAPATVVDQNKIDELDATDGMERNKTTRKDRIKQCSGGLHKAEAREKEEGSKRNIGLTDLRWLMLEPYQAVLIEHH